MEWFEKKLNYLSLGGNVLSTSLLEMNHIKKEFDGLQVLKDVSIHVNEGEVVSHHRFFWFG